MTDPPTMDLLDLDRRVLELTEQAIGQVTAVDLDRPTPCSAWNLGELLRHMVSENRGFAASAGSTPAPPSAWHSGDLGADPHRSYHDSAAAVTAAFGTPDYYDRRVEVREFGVFPGWAAI